MCLAGLLDSGNAWNQIHLGVDTYDWAGLDQEVAQSIQVWGPGTQFTYTVGGTFNSHHVMK